MPKNWDPSLNINSGRVEWPQGPLTDDLGFPFPEAGWTPRWIEAWVVQGDVQGGDAAEGVAYTGPSQRTAQWTDWAPGRWTADEIPPGWINGSFQTGPALGIALAAWHDGTTDKFEWWIDVINLY